MTNVSLANYTELFRSESREHITAINHLLLALESDPARREPVEGIFRGVHTIKGMAATMGCSGAAEVAHEMESVLEQLRSGRDAVSAGLLDLLFRAADALEIAVDDWVRTGESPAAPAALLTALRAERADVEPAPATIAAAAAPAAPAPRRLRVRLAVEADAALPGARAFLAVREARALGSIGELDPPEAALLTAGFAGELSFVLETDAPADAVRQRLLAIGDLTRLEVAPASPALPGTNGQGTNGQGTDGRATNGQGTNGQGTNRQGTSGQATSGQGTNGRDANGQGTSGAAPVATPAADTPVGRRHVRIDADRLDALMDRVGELVIVRDRLLRARPAQPSEALDDSVELVSRLVSQLRDEVLEMRMVPVREVFDRFPRLVRDAARALGKKVVLVVEGDDIELDRSLLERLGDPLVHLLRNAIDHGIEPPAQRLGCGKPEAGLLRLSARRERSRVLIRVEDDGRGIDRDRVIRRAAELGLLAGAGATGATGADDLALELVTRPGMSTADRVSEVSGRGVGLDVVATQVRGLRGTLDIASRPGEGTTFTLRLLASVGLLRALLVVVRESTYAIPIAHVAETVEFGTDEVHDLGGARVALLRDEPLPLIRVRDVLHGHASPRAAAAPRICVVVVETEEHWFGLEVDALLGQQEVVTKPFDATRATHPLFAGATILSDGSPALMLDAVALMRHGRSNQPARLFPGET